MSNIRLGVLGFRHGHIFSVYNRAQTKEGIEIVACCEEDAAAREAAIKNNVTMTHETFDALIADDSIDAVAIGACYGDRGALAIKALKAGKHVIADKPLCTSLKEFKKIKKLAKEKNLAVGVMLDLRDNPKVVTAAKLLNEGKIGKVNNINFEGQHPLYYGTRPDWYFEKGKHGGVINDIAIHGIDIARLFTKSDVEKVIGSRCWNFYADKEPDFLDSAQFMLKMGNGAGVIADVSYASPDSFDYNMPTYWRFELIGNKGYMIFDNSSDNLSLYINGATEVEYVNAVSGDKDYLDNFIEDIKGEKKNTVEYLNSSEQTLKVQTCAILG